MVGYLATILMAFARLGKLGRVAIAAAGTMAVAFTLYVSGQTIPDPTEGPSGPPDETLQITLPPASFVLDDASSRYGMPGSTLAGAHILIPGLGATPDRYVYFTHADSYGRATGIDPGPYESSLTGAAPVVVALSAGNNTGDTVATAVATALDALPEYTTVDRVGSVVTISGQIDADAATTGRAFADRIVSPDRGPGRILGMLHFRPGGTGGAGGSSGNITEARATRMIVSELPVGPVRVTGVAIQRSDTTTDPVRIALYEGGTSDASPVGATRVIDFGQFNGTGVAGWQTLMLTPSQVFETDFSTWVRPWVVFKGSATTTFYSLSTGSAFVGNYPGVAGAMYRIAAAGNSVNPTVAFEATIGAGTPGTFSFVPGIRIIVQRPGTGDTYSSDGSFDRLLGSYSPAGSYPDTTPIGVMVSTGFRAPNMLGLEAYSFEVAYGTPNAAGLFRAGLYQGGASNTSANGASLIWDAGITSNPGANAYATVTHPSGGVAVTANAFLWAFIRDDSSTSTIRFDAGVLAATTSTAEDPVAGYIDEGMVEYEITSAGGPPRISNNPNHSVSNDVAYEATLISHVSDALPGNLPSNRIRIRADGIQLAAL